MAEAEAAMFLLRAGGEIAKVEMPERETA